MKNYRLMILEFDGVIVESTAIKDDAFKELFKTYPQYLSAIMNYYRTAISVSRYDKFRYIYEEILTLPFSADISARLGENFSKMIYEKIVSAPLIKGAKDFLESFRVNQLLYLVSTTPAEELRAILAARELSQYFSDVYAYPWGTADAVRDILRRNDFYEKDAILIGSSLDSFKAARMTGIDFVGRQENSHWLEKECLVLKDMDEVSRFFTIQNNSV